eukprot:SAG31_NODE_12038_length_975_cov_0.936073_2_plen_136_part_00
MLKAAQKEWAEERTVLVEQAHNDADRAAAAAASAAREFQHQRQQWAAERSDLQNQVSGLRQQWRDERSEMQSAWQKERERTQLQLQMSTMQEAEQQWPLLRATAETDLQHLRAVLAEQVLVLVKQRRIDAAHAIN